ncbi:MAG: hypothetical protein CVV64_02485 [Candidatus Wallbacteria bacterium HGW-Wallbacteria-1]|jgi:tetratricopeptide (TPR) repeat protein|uniref:Uncharacterized protein n=1 Tax=Candidatus Wallbacteria bacterium HGW-Wallbacteria-1 TaxID=2013854 RepID=A0A2N1PVD4_9BACT|nr:MAG: hypothetical protein CVV64_02485 [Candidatus Wallbacteria bacterium HGW-Wallbacteria-1]
MYGFPVNSSMLKLTVSLMALCLFMGGCASPRYFAAGLYSSRAEALAAQKKLPEAIVEFENAVRVYPSSAWAERARFRIASLVHQQGRVKEARSLFRSIADGREGPGAYVTEARYRLGQILRDEGDLLSSKREFTEVLSGEPSEELKASAAKQIGEIDAWIESQGDRNELMDAWREYVDAYNSHAQLMMKIAGHQRIEPEEIHRAFLKVKVTQERYEKLLSSRRREGTGDDRLEQSRIRYMSSYERYIRIAEKLHPDEYDRPEVHEALEAYQKDKAAYLEMKKRLSGEKSDSKYDDPVNTDIDDSTDAGRVR